MKINIVNKSKNSLPEYKTKGSAGMDLQANLEEDIVLKPLERTIIPTGLYIELPMGYEAQIRARSGLALKQGLSLANGIGTIDSDYRGEIGIIIVNLSNSEIVVSHGDRVAQMVIVKYERPEIQLVETLTETERNEGGFGSTGV